MAKKPNTAVYRIAEAGLAIRQQEAAEAEAIGYYPRVMCQIALPASRFAGNEYERTSGNYHLSVQSPRILGVPWGIYPRGILAWIASDVTRRKNQEDTRVLHLGRSLAEFIQKVSGTTSMSGGTTGNIRSFKQQLASLFAARIFYWYDSGQNPPDAMTYRALEISTAGNLLWHPKLIDQPGLFQSTVTLGEAFHQDILDHAFPVDERALRALWPACLPTDIYVWLTYRASAMQRQRRTALDLTWLQLKAQFGPEYSTMRSFRQHFLLGLKKVKFVYGEMDFAESQKGIAFTLKRPSIRSVSVPLLRSESGAGN
jgi:hypothetical protein